MILESLQTVYVHVCRDGTHMAITYCIVGTLGNRRLAKKGACCMMHTLLVGFILAVSKQMANLPNINLCQKLHYYKAYTLSNAKIIRL